MTIQEKISRYQLIPKLIANLEENRARILNGKAYAMTRMTVRQERPATRLKAQC